MNQPSGGRRPITVSRVVEAVRSRLLERLQPLNAFRGVYGSFAEARQAAPAIKPVGYDAADSADWYTRKFSKLEHEDYPVLFWLREAIADSRSVFEIGGHVGVAFYGFGRVVKYPSDLTWTILDVPSIARAGEALAKERGEHRLKFVTAAGDVPGADVVLAAGALQYIESPTLAETISAFRHKPKHVFVNQTPVYDGAPFITIQNIGTAYCPYRVFNRAEFVGAMENLGYSLIDSWLQPRRFDLRSHPERSFPNYSGFYFAWAEGK